MSDSWGATLVLLFSCSVRLVLFCSKIVFRQEHQDYAYNQNDTSVTILLNLKGRVAVNLLLQYYLLSICVHVTLLLIVLHCKHCPSSQVLWSYMQSKSTFDLVLRTCLTINLVSLKCSYYNGRLFQFIWTDSVNNLVSFNWFYTGMFLQCNLYDRMTAITTGGTMYPLCLRIPIK